MPGAATLVVPLAAGTPTKNKRPSNAVLNITVVTQVKKRRSNSMPAALIKAGWRNQSRMKCA